MSRDGSGNYTLPALYNPVVANTPIETLWANTTLDDIATALTSSISTDGVSVVNADIPMNSHKFTSVSDATARTQFASLGQVQDSAVIWGGTSGGTANAITISLTPSLIAYKAGQIFQFINGVASNTTTTPTLNIDSLGAKTIIARDGTALAAGDIPNNAMIEVIYDGTNFRLITEVPSMKLLSTFSASGETSIDIEGNFNSTYDVYMLVISNVLVSSGGEHIKCRLKIAGSYQTTSYVCYTDTATPSGAAYISSTSLGSANAIYLSGAMGVVNSTDRFNTVIKIYNPSSTTSYKNIDYKGSCYSTGVLQNANGFGRNEASSSALTGIRIYCAAVDDSSGDNFVSGSFQLYGLRK